MTEPTPIVDADYRLADCPLCEERYDHVLCLNCERESQVVVGDDTCPLCLAPTLTWVHEREEELIEQPVS